MSNRVDVIIGAEVSGALQGLQKVEAATVKAGATINKLPAAVNSATQAIAKIKPGSNEASQSLINLSRVAQDAPYGFLGIANNINPLLESFQRLKTSTGTTGGALKALGSSLVGGGGLGLAVGVVSSLLVVFGDKLFGAGKKAKEASEEQKKYNETLQSAIGAVADEAAKVAGLVRFIQLETTSKKERINAIKELQSISPAYFATLDAEKASIGQLSAAYNIYLLSLRRAVEAKVTEKQLSDIIERRLELEKKLYRPITEQIMLNGRLVTVRNAVYDADGTVKKQQEELVDLRKDELTLANKLALLKPPQIKPADFKAPKVKADTIDFESQFSKIVYLSKPIQIQGRIFDFNAAQAGTDLLKKLEYEFGDRLKSMEKLVVTPKINLSSEALRNHEALKGAADFANSINDAFKTALINGASDSISAFSEGIGEAFAGGDLKSAFAGFAGAIGGAVQAIGKQFISLGVAALLAKKAIKLTFANPALAIEAGAALVAVGAAMKSALSNFGGFRAAGGPVGQGQSYVVGENGPELFVPANSGRIMNGNQVAAMSYSGGGSSGGGRQIIRGQNIILSYARTNRAQNRLGRG